LTPDVLAESIKYVGLLTAKEVPEVVGVGVGVGEIKLFKYIFEIRVSFPSLLFLPLRTISISLSPSKSATATDEFLTPISEDRFSFTKVPPPSFKYKLDVLLPVIIISL
jgi:hypothetical protein